MDISNLTILQNDEILERVLSPMFQILDEKNITKGITIKKENDKLYICFDRNCLSDSNQLILEKISHVYSETLFYSNDKQFPNADRLEYWCPDEDYDKKTHITERCKDKKIFVLELDANDQFTILGTSIMLANALQEQDPIHLKVNEEMVVFESDVIERQKHYISSGYPDLKCIHLIISLNKDNPLNENPYAPFMSVCEINSSVSCDNMVLQTLVGCNEKTYISFCMDKEDIEKTIKGYFERQVNNGEENKKLALSGAQKKLLKN